MRYRNRTLPWGMTLALVMVFMMAAGACSGGADESSTAVEAISAEVVADFDAAGTTITLVTHDSFLVSEGIWETFTNETGITVDVVAAGDAGELVSRAVLSAGAPEGDVLFGIDNTFVQRGLNADLFVPYQSPNLATVPAELVIDDEGHVTPIDFGDVCVNYWIDALPDSAAASTSGAGADLALADLTDPALAQSFVTQDPESSSPGFALLLATIATFGDDPDTGWENYWQQLADGGVTVTSGWTDAYYGEFVAGGGDKALVTSYASSPVAEIVFGETGEGPAPTGVIEDSCFRQIEFAGVLRGTEHPEAAAKLIDFMLSPTFQADIPLNMFVLPANSEVELPPVFVDNLVTPTNPLTIDPATIEANRAEWTERWFEIVVR